MPILSNIQLTKTIKHAILIICPEDDNSNLWTINILYKSA